MSRFDNHSPKCPTCKSDSQYPITESPTINVEYLSETYIYHDKTGKHYHSHGYDSKKFTCANKHEWYVNLYDHCPVDKCDWTRDNEDVRIKSIEKQAKQKGNK